MDREAEENGELSYLYRLVSPQIYDKKELELARKFLIKGFLAAKELGYRKPPKEKLVFDCPYPEERDCDTCQTNCSFKRWLAKEAKDKPPSSPVGYV